MTRASSSAFSRANSSRSIRVISFSNGRRLVAKARVWSMRMMFHSASTSMFPALRSMFATRLSKTRCRQTCFAHEAGFGHADWSTSLIIRQPSIHIWTAAVSPLDRALDRDGHHVEAEEPVELVGGDLGAVRLPVPGPAPHRQHLNVALDARPPGAKKIRLGLVTPIGTSSIRATGAVRRYSSSSA